MNLQDEFLASVRDKWDGQTDHIAMMAGRVRCLHPQWTQWFRKWFLYMVAQWRGMVEEHGNSTVPLLISEQGYNKSTFCRQLLPPELRRFYIDNPQIAEKKQMMRLMHQMLLINLDEFNQIKPAVQDGFLKNIVQLAKVQDKMPYRSMEVYPRTASFIATTNEVSVLSDPTGSRRFIGVQLTGPIDVESPVDYTQLYGQAVSILSEYGEQYWMTKEEEAEIMVHNRQFQMQPPVVQAFLEHYAIVQSEDEGAWTSSTSIYEHLRKKVGASLEVGSVIALGRYLAHIPGLQRKQSMRQTLYLVRLK